MKDFHLCCCYLLSTAKAKLCRANHWTGFYMVMASVMKEIKVKFNKMHWKNSRF